MLIPTNYIGSLNTRLSFYRKLAYLKENSKIQDIKDEMITTFGELPAEVKNLFMVTELRSLCKKSNIEKIEQLEMQEEKADAQRRMAWISLLSMIVFTLLVFMPIFPDSRIKALADLFGLFYIGMAGVVGAYMGMTAYMSRK